MVSIKNLYKKANMPLYCITGMMFDFSVYFYWLVLPVLLKKLQAGPILIGAADAVTFCLAGVLAPIMGILTDKWRGEILCELACILQALSCIFTAIYYVNNTGTSVLFIFLIIQGIGLAAFWSPDETLIGAESYIGEENKNISNFAMLSAFGKAVGFLLGGSAISILGASYSLYVAAVLPLFVFIIFPRKPRYKNDETNPKKVFQNTVKNRSHPKTFYYSSIVVHLFLYGVIAIISNQYVDYADDHHIHLNGISEEASVFVGVFLFVENVVQTITFIVLGRWSYWQYKQRFNLLALCTMLVVALGLLFSPNGWIVMIFSVPMGIVAGYELQANLYYSITVSHNHGKFLGISEFIGEMTYSLSPFICGLLCSAFGKTWLHFLNIFMCCCGILIISIVASVYKRTTNIFGFNRVQSPSKVTIELDDISRSSADVGRSSMDTVRTSTSLDGSDIYRTSILKVLRDEKGTINDQTSVPIEDTPNKPTETPDPTQNDGDAIISDGVEPVENSNK
ncbi:transporter, major facilitator family protein [Entamoeba nuttalli P19]|uniref:Transporter, major facilitator family protein n=2 Tax=Entamoeba nuttalli TaxID=412467 RepID=K2HV16_ENTNP|nr:transporter, major facilitator family protein [Entamoeba nuttalli P19]EKE40040.1 transporter, major facilitator family protein [Entamoeba nuttalli P19]|eukprot:XP_008857621.1 transporter, major facilitator family protein [Entamoeba nuttalli P19]